MSRWFVLFFAICLAGCETGYIWSLESLGFQHQEIYVNSLGNFQDELTVAERTVVHCGDGTLNTKACVKALKTAVAAMDRQRASFRRAGKLWFGSASKSNSEFDASGTLEQQITYINQTSLELVSNTRDIRKRLKHAEGNNEVTILNSEFDLLHTQLIDLNQKVDELTILIEAGSVIQQQ